MSSNSKNYSVSLQSLKGMAALMVFLSHALGMYRSETISVFRATPFNFVCDGQCAVVLFFCLTGFFTFREEIAVGKDYINQVAKKAIRIYPPYLIVTALAWIIANNCMEYDDTLFTNWSNSFWQDQVSIGSLIKAMLLIVPFDTNILNPPTWYIQVDMRMAFLLPILTSVLLFLKKYKPIGLLLLCLMLSILQPPFCLMFLPYYGGGIFLNIC